ncbi:hypothetical protein ACFQVC_01005 [Streptomyces monticola]|uniref:Uncharacterized protein n=1 Tax=Streptomyces monticola TaxID=2666263 RepID=A0ABW2JB48_9ACTN
MTARASRLQLTAWTAGAGAGATVGYGAILLAARARAYCDAGWEAGGKLELNVLLVPVMAAFAGAALLGAMGARRATAQGSRGARATAQLLAVALVLTALTWWIFAWLGTLDGYPGDSGLCPASNVPPWWPHWIPA